MLLKVCLILGVEIHVNVEFTGLLEPPVEQPDAGKDIRCYRCASRAVGANSHPPAACQATDGKRWDHRGTCGKVIRKFPQEVFAAVALAEIY